MSVEPAHKRLKLMNAMHRTMTTRSIRLRRVMNEVPDEIWLQILGHLGIVDISRVGATCTRLYILAKDLSLWEKLEFDIANMSSSLGAVESVIDRAANVKEMRFTNLKNKRFDSMTVVSLIVRARKTLKVLTLSRRIELEDVAVARFGCLVKLEVLNLVLERISPTGVKAIAKLKNLRELRIPLTNLREFRIPLTDIDLKYLFGELKNLVVLELSYDKEHIQCSLSYIEITQDTFRTLAQNNPSLETVILQSCYMLLYDATQQPSLADLTTNCPNLKHLSLSGWEGISEDDINALGQSKKLLHLDLSWCNQMTQMTDNMLINISMNCSELRYLDLRGVIVKHDFIRSLAQNCPNLLRLKIQTEVEFMYEHIAIINA